jgi:cytochrome c oxidase subunit 3
MEASSLSAGTALHDDQPHGPPRPPLVAVEPQLLGMLLFIISEVMIFGAFFHGATFFIRSVPDNWFPCVGTRSVRSPA